MSRLPHFLRFAFLAFIFCIVLFTACEDEGYAPAYCFELAEVRTDHVGKARSILRDNGEELVLAETTRPSGLTPDSAYRMYVVYLRSDGEAELQSLSEAFSTNPILIENDGDIRRDPLELEALWRGGHYLNFRVGLKTDGTPHTLAYIYKGMRANSAAGLTLCLELYHDCHGAQAHYTSETYLSCPLYSFEELFTHPCDSIEVTVTTYGGTVVRQIAYSL